MKPTASVPVQEAGGLGDNDAASGAAESCSITGSPGARLHSAVPPERWCVTRGDLRDLRREVQKAVRAGKIVPTPRDDFDPKDHAVGPNFYTVVEQHIKPGTAESQASWALQRNPNGLDCDLFVTHAWAEGIYEFIDKVLASWPRAARHAWICTLSMPQHLNVTELLSDPRGSPFAKALGSATQVLVVPNQHRSIYTRLWCVYEAFLAQEQGKTIRTAARSHSLSGLRAFVCVLPGCAFGFLMRHVLASHPAYAVLSTRALKAIIPVVLCFTAVVRDSSVRFSMHLVGAALSSFLFGSIAMAALLFFLYFAISEVDRARLTAYEKEVANLKHGFEGSVRFAECTDVADKAAIWTDVGGDAERVDHAIDVLMRAKTSAPLWSELAAEGFDVQDAAFRECSFLLPAFAFHLYGCLTTINASRNELVELAPLAPFAVADLVAIFMWTIFMCRFDAERRSFSFLLLQKMSMLIIGVLIVTILVGGNPLTDIRGQEGSYTLFLAGLAASSCLTLGISAIHPLSLVRIPHIGPCIVHLVLLRVRVRICRFKLCCRRAPPPGCAPSSGSPGLAGLA